MTSERRRDAAGVRRLLLVVGLGRSGTSAFTSILGRLGFHVPQPEVRADETNPRGFGEPRWVVDFHARLMRERRVTVFDSRPAAWEATADAATDDAAFEELRSWLAVQFVGVDNVVVKDPRIAWFLPLWLRCGDDLGVATSFATMVRHPVEVVASARRSYGAWQSDASRAAAWLNITLHAEWATRGAGRAFIRYEDVLADWSREVSRTASLLDLPWLVDVAASRHPDVDAFVDPSLRRSSAGWEDVAIPPVLRALLETAWPRVSALASPGGDDGGRRALLDEARAAYVELYSEAEAIAQSSVTAAKRRREQSAKRAASVDGDARGEGDAALVLRIIRRIPPRYRGRVPLPVRRGLLRTGRSLVRALRR
ncbi:MAG: sulfotransferase [Actinomycetota bacterium]|nr:sulfotransferase [Actinomycetota bacterium]